MKDLFIEINAKLKKILGLCNSKHCYKRAIADIYIPAIDTKRCLCDKHLLEFQKMDLISSIRKKVMNNSKI